MPETSCSRSPRYATRARPVKASWAPRVAPPPAARGWFYFSRYLVLACSTVRGLLSKRVFPFLQLTRLALVFTAISNSLCTLMLANRQKMGEDGGGTVLRYWSWTEAGLIALVSFGLYAYGMSLNDINDRRRDRTLA